MWKDTSLWDEVHRDMDRMFGTLSRLPCNSLVESNYREPLVDMEEDDKEIIVTAELPGLDKKDITVTPAKGGIDIRAEKQAEASKHDKGMYRYERNYTGFYRYVALPDEADATRTNARYNKGVLELHIPKVAGKREKIQIG